MDRRKYANASKNQLKPNIFNRSLALEACIDGLYDYFLQNNQLTQSEPSKKD